MPIGTWWRKGALPKMFCLVEFSNLDLRAWNLSNTLLGGGRTFPWGEIAILNFEFFDAA